MYLTNMMLGLAVSVTRSKYEIQ